MKSIPDFLIFSSCLLVQHRTNHRLLVTRCPAFDTIYTRASVGVLRSSLYSYTFRSVVELSLRIFFRKILSRNFSTKIGNSLYSYTLLEYFSCPNELNQSENEPKKTVIRLKKSSDPFECVGEERINKGLNLRSI